MRFVLATANEHKVKEIKDLLHDADLLARPKQVGDIPETADSLLGNARIKAQAVLQITKEASIADDTGLEVDFLNGAPGVYSARFAGKDATAEQNRTKLLESMVLAKTQPQRTARFRTVVFVAFPNGKQIYTQGTVEGFIATCSLGDDGFGYDSLFIPTEGDGRTFAQMSLEEKQQISHRAKAFRSLKKILIEEHIL